MLSQEWIKSNAAMISLLAYALSLGEQTQGPIPSLPRLPAAKEEFLGDTPVYWFARFEWTPDGFRYAMPVRHGWGWAVVIDGQLGPEFNKVGDPRFVSEGRHVVYVAERGSNRCALVIDGEAGPEFTTLERLSFSSDGKQYAYLAKGADNRWLYIADGKEIQLSAEFAEVHLPEFSHDRQHLAFWAKSGPNRWVVVWDGKAGPEFEVPEFVPAFKDAYNVKHKTLTYPDSSTKFGPLFSPDGLHMAYRVRLSGSREVLVVDGKASPEFKAVELPLFSPDSRHFGYQAERADGKQVQIVDGKEGSEFQKISWFQFSPDGAHFAYSARRAAGKSVVIFDGNEGPEFEDVQRLTFSPDGRSFAYEGKRAQGRWVMVVNGKESREYALVGQPYFSPVGGRLAYGAKSDSAYTVVLDNKPGPAFDALSSSAAYDSPNSGLDTSTVTFSPNGERVAYVARRGEKRLIVVDGQEGPEYQFILSQPLFSEDSAHVAYVAWENNTIVVVVDGKPVNRVSQLKGIPLWSGSRGSEERRDYNWTADQLGRLGPFTYPAMLGAILIGNAKADSVNFVREMAFSPDGHRFACVLGHGGSSFATGASSRGLFQVLVDGQQGRQYTCEGIDDLTFSPDNRHLACIVVYSLDKKAAVDLDGNEGRIHSKILSDPGLRFIGESSLVYIARDGRKIYRVTQPLP